MKSNVLVMVAVCFFGMACDEYPNVVRACVNYRLSGQYCGSGFFISPDEIITAKHITDRSEDNVFRILRHGEDNYSWDWNYDLGFDMNKVTFKTELTGSICPVCPNVVVGAEVTMVGMEGPGVGEIAERQGTLSRISEGWLIIKGRVPKGFSGGPVVDDERNCVIGVISGDSQSVLGHTVAGILTQERLAEIDE